MNADEIKKAISELTSSEVAALSDWLAKYKSALEDGRIEPDAIAGIRRGLAQMEHAESRPASEVFSEVRGRANADISWA
jgi:hypothetical protein